MSASAADPFDIFSEPAGQQTHANHNAPNDLLLGLSDINFIPEEKKAEPK